MGYADVANQLRASELFLQASNSKDENFSYHNKTIKITNCNTCIESARPGIPPELKYDLILLGNSLTIRNVIISSDAKVSLIGAKIHIENVVVNGDLFTKGDVTLKNTQQYDVGHIHVNGDLTIQNDDDKSLNQLSIISPGKLNINSFVRVRNLYFTRSEKNSQETRILNVALGNRNQIIPQKDCQLTTGSIENCAPFRIDDIDRDKISHINQTGKSQSAAGLFGRMTAQERENIMELIKKTPEGQGSSQLTAEQKAMFLAPLDAGESTNSSDA